MTRTTCRNCGKKLPTETDWSQPDGPADLAFCWEMDEDDCLDGDVWDLVAALRAENAELARQIEQAWAERDGFAAKVAIIADATAALHPANVDLFIAAKARDPDAYLFGQILANAALERAFTGPPLTGDIWPDWVYALRKRLQDGEARAAFYRERWTNYVEFSLYDSGVRCGATGIRAQAEACVADAVRAWEQAQGMTGEGVRT